MWFVAHLYLVYLGHCFKGNIWVIQPLELEFGGEAQDLAILIRTLGGSYGHGIGSTLIKSHCPLIRVFSSYEQVPGTNLFQNSKGPSISHLLTSTWINEMSLKF